MKVVVYPALIASLAALLLPVLAKIKEKTTIDVGSADSGCRICQKLKDSRGKLYRRGQYVLHRYYHCRITDGWVSTGKFFRHRFESLGRELLCRGQFGS